METENSGYANLPTIIIVSADPWLSDLLMQELSHMECSILTFTSGTEGIMFAKTIKNLAIFVADDTIRDMTGVEALEEIRRVHSVTQRVLFAEKIEIKNLFTSLISKTVNRAFSRPIKISKVIRAFDRMLQEIASDESNQEFFTITRGIFSGGNPEKSIA